MRKLDKVYLNLREVELLLNTEKVAPSQGVFDELFNLVISLTVIVTYLFVIDDIQAILRGPPHVK